MGKNYYIVAIELSSSKISGAVGIETTEGMKILATASTPVEGFITKGIVRNVDKTSEAITTIVNILDSKLRNVVQECLFILTYHFVDNLFGNLGVVVKIFSHL